MAQHCLGKIGKATAKVVLGIFAIPIMLAMFVLFAVMALGFMCSDAIEDAI